jgi:hypothetical protein
LLFTSVAKMPSYLDRADQGSVVAAGKQSRFMSLVEAITNVAAGYLLALLTQITIFPMFGLVVSVADNLLISGIFTGVSLLRSYTLRRLFETVLDGRN